MIIKAIGIIVVYELLKQKGYVDKMIHKTREFFDKIDKE